jgi:hypothetical protein
MQMASKDERNKFLEGLGEFAITMAVIVVYAFTLSCMWQWFITPIGVPAIGVAHAYGVVLFTNTLFMNQLLQPTMLQGQPQIVRAATKVILSLLMLVIGWIVNALFM